MGTAHEVNAWLLIASNAAVGLWCLAAYRWPRIGGLPMWIAVIVAQATAVVQAITGALWASADELEIDDMHMLYGVSALIGIAIMYSYRTSGFMKGKESLLYGFGSLFVMGLGIRNLAL